MSEHAAVACMGVVFVVYGGGYVLSLSCSTFSRSGSVAVFRHAAQILFCNILIKKKKTQKYNWPLIQVLATFVYGFRSGFEWLSGI